MPPTCTSLPALEGKSCLTSWDVSTEQCGSPASHLAPTSRQCCHWYDYGMTTKVAISLPDDVLASARQAVAEGRASSLSGYISSALAERQDYEDLAELLAEMAAETGGPSDEDRRWARQALGID